MFKHTGEKQFSCTLCGAKFRNNSQLYYHKKLPNCQAQKTEEKVAEYECETCGKGFISLSGYNNHQLTHTGEKPHSCQLCGDTFRFKSQLYTHKKSKHSDYFSFEEQSREKNKPKKPAKVKKFSRKRNEKDEMLKELKELTESSGYDDVNETKMATSEDQLDYDHEESDSIDIEEQPAYVYNEATSAEIELSPSTRPTTSPAYDNGLTKHHQDENDTKIDPSDEQWDSHHKKDGSFEIEKQSDYVFNEDTGVASCIHCLEEIKCSKSQRHLVPFFIKKHLETCNPL